jgi:hypothetical protein
MSIINKWTVKQLNFVEDYPQAPIQTEMYMDIPKGYLVDGADKFHALKLIQNIYPKYIVQCMKIMKLPSKWHKCPR